MTKRWLLLEPYYDGSHRHLVDGLLEGGWIEGELWTLSARKWKWRMRGSSLAFAERARREPVQVDGIFATSMLNAAELRALLPVAMRSVPLVMVFHENQLAYPVQHFDKRDHHFAWTQLHAALAAEHVFFNSEFNRRTFLDGLEALARKMPDHRPTWAVEAIRSRSSVLGVPIDARGIARDGGHVTRRGPCHVVWNHRWEFDKGPDLLLGALESLVELDLDFEISVLGQSFREIPEVFEEIREAAGGRVRSWGFLESREEYRRTLASADVALSTARHEFQGLAVLEAAAAGAVPLVPAALAYPEIWPAEWCYADEADLVENLVERIRHVGRWRTVDPRPLAERFDWSVLGPEWRAALEQAASGAPGDV